MNSRIPYKYKQPSKIRISKEQKVNFIDIIDVVLRDIAAINYTDPKVPVDHPHHQDILDLNDLHKELQGVDYLIGLLQKIKEQRTKETDKLLGKIFKK